MKRCLWPPQHVNKTSVQITKKSRSAREYSPVADCSCTLSTMSRYNDERPSPKGIMRPHSFDIGVHEHQSQQDRTKGRGRGRGVYKSGSGTFMFASTSMSAALDNLQFYPKVITPRAASAAEELTLHAGGEACLSVLNRMTSQALSASISCANVFTHAVKQSKSLCWSTICNHMCRPCVLP